MLLSNDAYYINTPVVPDAAAIKIGSLKVGEAVLSNLALVDGPVRVVVEVWEDIAV